MLDVVIVGGGVAGLWLLDTLHEAGRHVLLLEKGELGGGQTIASQGIIHGGLKYTLDGLLSPSANAIREMPRAWRDCLAGARTPRLTQTRVRAEYCHLWRTRDWASQVGMLGARFGLRVRPQRLPRAEWPAALRHCPGEVYRLDEQVIDCAAMIAELAGRHAPRILKCDADGGLLFQPEAAGRAGGVRLSAGGRTARLQAGVIILAAGAGNAELRRAAGLDAAAQQVRPLHMVMVRGALPELNGHCTDGARTRVTITTAQDGADRTVWQVGGQVAEDGVNMSPDELVAHARRELAAVLPGVPLTHAEWSTYRADRAEAAAGGRRPSDVQIRREGDVLTVWPTKLALAPRLAERVLRELPPAVHAAGRSQVEAALRDWPRPRVARPPWEAERRWQR
ncbi:MAG: FAD-dependent oxidoreductase [Phycisphaerae bacterium]|nr:FAD-dependent oxidoreductase [Phycisphaerae bacterium]